MSRSLLSTHGLPINGLAAAAGLVYPNLSLPYPMFAALSGHNQSMIVSTLQSPTTVPANGCKKEMSDRGQQQSNILSQNAQQRKRYNLNAARLDHKFHTDIFKQWSFIVFSQPLLEIDS